SVGRRRRQTKHAEGILVRVVKKFIIASVPDVVGRNDVSGTERMLNLQIPLNVLWIENHVGRVLKGWPRASGRSRIQEAANGPARIVGGLECLVTTSQKA